MYFLFAIVPLIGLAFPVIAIVALVKASNNEKRITKLEERLARMGSASVLVDTKITTPQPLVENTTETLHKETEPLQETTPLTIPINQTQNQKLKESEKDTDESEFESWLKRDWLMKLGGLLVILGLLFLLSIAFTGMGPVGKVLTGYVIGVSLMLFGFFWAKKFVYGGTSINIIGAVIILFTTSAARTPSFDLFSPLTGLMLIFATALFMAFTSLVYQKQYIAHIALIAAFLAPILINFHSETFTSLLVYFLVITLGILWLALVSGWRMLLVVSQVGILLYSIPEMQRVLGSVDTINGLNFLLVYVFGFLFFLVSTLSIIRSKGQTVSEDGIIAVLNGVFAAAWIFTAVSKGWQGILLASVALVYAAGSFAIFRITKNASAFLVYSSVALSLLLLATIVQFSGVARALLLVFEGGLATIFACLLVKDNRVTTFMVLANIPGALLVFQAITSLLSRHSVSPDAVFDSMLLSLVSMAFYLVVDMVLRKSDHPTANLFTVVNSFFAILFIWGVTHYHMGLSYGTASVISLIIYTIAGLVVLITGSWKQNENLIKIGRILLGAVALRVLFVDAWSLGSTMAGIFVCIGVGVLLLSTTLITRK